MAHSRQPVDPWPAVRKAAYHGASRRLRSKEDREDAAQAIRRKTGHKGGVRSIVKTIECSPDDPASIAQAAAQVAAEQYGLQVEVRSLPVALTDEELLRCGREVARATQEEQALAERKKEANAQFALDAKRLNTEVMRLGAMIATGREYRDVRCSVDVRGGRRRVFRGDTGEMIEDQPVTAPGLFDE